MYSVKIKKPGSLLHKTYRKVLGDGIVWFEDKEKGQHFVEARWLILEGGRRIEVPFKFIMEFSKEREDEIRRDIKNTAGGMK